MDFLTNVEEVKIYEIAFPCLLAEHANSGQHFSILLQHMFLEWRQIFRQIDDVMSEQIQFQKKIHDLNFTATFITIQQ